MRVEFERGESLLITDGPAAAIYRDGHARLTHREAALGRSYWTPTQRPLPPDVPADLPRRLAALRKDIEAQAAAESRPHRS